MQDSFEKMPAAGFSSACERNKKPILEVLGTFISAGQSVLEVGSGTGQHAVSFAAEFPSVSWQPADTGAYLPGLRTRLHNEAPDNVLDAINLDERMNPWPVDNVDVVFSANTLHFMSKDCVAEFFRGVDQVLQPDGYLMVYGPFNYGGEFSSASNADFEAWLKGSDPDRGIRDFEWVCDLAELYGLQLLKDFDMPANNRALLWRKLTGQ
jgi:cyclopropane fatty-acyl-phospholipid synthase-like methyltransferase